MRAHGVIRLLRRLLPTRRPPAAPVIEPTRVDVTGGPVVRCGVPPDVNPARHATLRAMRDATRLFGFVPAALLAQKAKSVTDGVLATLESLSTDGTPACMGVEALLERVCARLDAGCSARERIQAARDLARGTPPRHPDACAFLADPVRSKPLGFYTWGDDLAGAFRRDRHLQERLEEREAQDLWDAIRGDEGGCDVAYLHHLRRIARLTNPLSRSSLAHRAERIASGAWNRDPQRPERAAVFPPSGAPENDYESIHRFFAAVRAGERSLEPRPSSGFYAHQQRTLDPLLRPDAFPEASRRQVDAEYAEVLERFAGANLFFARESHVKQLEIPVAGMAAAPVRRVVHPDVKIEPLPSYYAFVADAFRFLRTVVEEGWGDAALSAPQRRESGTIAATLAEGIDEVVGLCELAAETSRRELDGRGSGDAVVDAGRARLFSLWQDDDATGDVRGMVPLAVLEDGRVRALVQVGWEVRRLVIALLALPGAPRDCALGAVAFPLPVPVVGEIVVPAAALLDRGEVRRACDEALRARASALLSAPGSAPGTRTVPAKGNQ